MKKYFIQETGKEITFGDRLELDFTKELRNGHIKHHHIDCTFIPQLLPLLLESEIIEEREVFQEDTINHSSDNFLEERIIKLEGIVADLQKKIEVNTNNIAYLFNKLPEYAKKGK